MSDEDVLDQVVISSEAKRAYIAFAMWLADRIAREFGPDATIEDERARVIPKTGELEIFVRIHAGEESHEIGFLVPPGHWQWVQ
jgi:hypothetical protein